MLSSRAKYALRACVFLAERQRQEPDDWALSPDIAEAEDIPRKFLEAILVELRDHGIVESRRGRYGGYRLAHPAVDIAASDVIRIVDGPLALAPCASKTQFGPCADCLDAAFCALQPMLRKARDAIAGVLDGYMLSQLARDRREAATRRPHEEASPIRSPRTGAVIARPMRIHLCRASRERACPGLDPGSARDSAPGEGVRRKPL